MAEDDLDDRGAADLMRRWGKGERLFEPPRDRSRMHAALDAVDREIEAGGARRAGTRRTWGTLAVAASLLLVAGAAWYLGWFRGATEPVDAPHLAQLQLDYRPDIVRSEQLLEFRSGDELYVVFESDCDGWAALCMLDSGGKFTHLPEFAACEVRAGRNHLVSSALEGGERHETVVLDDNPGREAFVVLTTPNRMTGEALAGIADRVSDTLAKSEADTFAERLSLVLGELQHEPDLAIAVLEFTHLP